MLSTISASEDVQSTSVQMSIKEPVPPRTNEQGIWGPPHTLYSNYLDWSE